MLPKEKITDNEENINEENVKENITLAVETTGATAEEGQQEFRVRNVSEINGNNIENSLTSELPTTSKRKLPLWMISQDSDSGEPKNGKKCKTDAESNTPANDEILAGLENNIEVESIENNLSAAEENETQAVSTNCSEKSKTETEAESKSTISPSAQVKVKTEPESTDDTEGPRPSSSGTSNPVDIKPAVKVEKADATSSTSRESCQYGIRCYRRNPMHRVEEAHPGDDDYRRPNYPQPPKGTPDCPYGNSCYRRNPTHFQQYTHPPDTDFAKNYKMHCMRLRQRRQQQIGTNNNDNDSDALLPFDSEDPFLNDSDIDSDYVPSDENDYDDTEDFMADYDDCDKAEE